jgi:hypothetical protein
VQKAAAIKQTVSRGNTNNIAEAVQVAAAELSLHTVSLQTLQQFMLTSAANNLQSAIVRA